MLNKWTTVMDWGEGIPTQQAYERASGRRHYNAIRRLNRELRRGEVAQLLSRYGLLSWGVQSKIAAVLKVNRSTICRDIQSLLRAKK